MDEKTNLTGKVSSEASGLEEKAKRNERMETILGGVMVGAFLAVAAFNALNYMTNRDIEHKLQGVYKRQALIYQQLSKVAGTNLEFDKGEYDEPCQCTFVTSTKATIAYTAK